MSTEYQLRLNLRKPRRPKHPPVPADSLTPTGYPEHDFGPFGCFVFSIVQHRPRGGFTYRYGRPSNVVTAGMPVSEVPRFKEIHVED